LPTTNPHPKDSFGNCQVLNEACKDENGFFVNVNTILGCAEKCMEDDKCNW